MAEVIAFVQSGLKDLSISRTSINWGIPFPGDDHHVTYVWADALNNYITGIGYGDPAREQEFNFWWPADLQVLGKDIVRFHAVFWPAFLMASNLAQPKKLLVHGWIKIGEHKMSKSRGNAVDPIELAATYGVDQVRYYLVRHLAITQDSPFTYPELEQRINSDLAHDLGNLLNRMVTLALKNDLSQASSPSEWGQESTALYETGKNIIVRFMQEMEAGYMNRAYAIAWEYIQAVNKYFHVQEPWKQVKTSPEKFAETISATCHALYAIGYLCWPLMPTKMEQLFKQLGTPLMVSDFEEIVSNHRAGRDTFAELLSQPWNKTFVISLGEILFSKIEPQEEPTMIEEVKTTPTITIDDFAKVELRVGTIEDVQTLEKSDKLYVLKVNFGPFGVRQILSGIRKSFTPEQLLQRQGIFVFNLAPRKMMGLESQGMMLFAKDAQEQLTLISPEHAVPNGTQLS
jgi:methionyl-tRNA synthetase